MANKNLLHSTGKSTYYSVMAYVGKSAKKRGCVYCTLIHFAVHMKLTQHCKPTILRFLFSC